MSDGAKLPAKTAELFQTTETELSSPPRVIIIIIIIDPREVAGD